MILGRPPRLLRRTFPLIAAALFFLIAFAPDLNLTHLPFPNDDYSVWGTFDQGIAPLGDGLRYLGATLGFLVLVVGSPVFFSGLIFSRSFRDIANPSEALGVNLMGAVVGGTLENTVMIGGTAFLGGLAVVLYALSAVFIFRMAH